MNDVANAVNGATKVASDLAGNAGRSATDARDRLGEDMAAVKTELAELSRRITGAVGAFGAVAQEEGRLGLGRARTEAGAVASEASGRAAVAAEALSIVAQDQASSIGGLIADSLERRPVVSLSVAVAIGFLIGAALRR
ncbi:hypothetical protein DFR50_1426 [Roseiarcus fermentans]|uniref:ElaB/YqjD/DUF883 family membrane-anchored ribosome-binding protein n=1 Tax=Roseiarcus fermentans TaxID=1473586 RepID=A0A366EQI1_9HYPH|nr:hypothetical protein [Roseiarcus fermentans]RBP03759.1 hypothetical protein DFR50_1426 [Roseiarcus fermentans]